MNFEELELHPKITKKLQKAGFTTLTTIQQKTLPITLTGKSIIASSKTGSGKTLCFLLPILQKLRTLKWNINDGLGALILTPTRELALQINDVLLKINNKHKTSVVIGGVSKEQDLDAEIIIATPGRFLDHMQSVDLGNYNLQLLVLDEADKMLEMGFKEDIEEILDYFNKTRQTLLFSATPNSLVAKIGNLVDNDAEIVCDDEVATIKQIFYKVEMKDKPALLYEFMKKQKQKALVFFSTCKEVKFYHKLFRKLGFFVNYFAGAMGQNKRIDQLNDFIENGRFLFCTDVGARGLDFNVDTVLQLDCAESVETYVHRMGRTGRNNKEGTNIVYLVGDEERIIDDFKKGKWKRMAKNSEMSNLDDCLISIKERKDANERYKKEIREKIIESGEMQILAEKYIISYLRFLEMGKRRYFGESVSRVESLMENLGVKVNLQENKKDKDENRKKEKKNTDE